MSQLSWIGQTLKGRYRIEELVGQGGMSAVYKAADPNLKRVVAIKMIHAHLSDNAEFVRRFEEEAALVAQLRHPNILQVYDFDHQDGSYFMVLEFIPGETLQGRLKRLNEKNRRMPSVEAAGLIAQLADAAQYAHARGLVHRDIKPANIMLDVHGKAILMDFGVSRIVGGTSHTATGAVLGTAKYMSPEQITGERVDERSDIYSLGVTLFEALSGRPPFEADSAMTLIMMHVNDQPPDIRELQPDIPARLADVVEKALKKKRELRFQSMAEMAAALHAAVAEGPAVAGDTAGAEGRAGAGVPGDRPARQEDQAAGEVHRRASPGPADVSAQPPTPGLTPQERSSRPVTSQAGAPADGELPAGTRASKRSTQAQPEALDNRRQAQPPGPQDGGQADRPGQPSGPQGGGQADRPGQPYGPQDNRGKDRQASPYGPQDGGQAERPGQPYGPQDNRRQTRQTQPPGPQDGGQADRPGQPYGPQGAGKQAQPAPAGGRKTFGLGVLAGVGVALLGLVVLVIFGAVLLFRDLMGGDGLVAAAETQVATPPATATAGDLAAADNPRPTATRTRAATATQAATRTLDLPLTAPTLVVTATPTVPPGIYYVRINKITVENNRYVVEYETFLYTEQLPGMHVHFFFDTVAPEQAGMPGSGPWILYGGPRPFTKYGVADRPAHAEKMCALVANTDHSIQLNSGNCYPLP